MTASPLEVIHRLVQATNDHDLEGIVACFAATYVNETPAHPSRGFEGEEQVRRNWAQILGGVPDVSAEVLESVTDGATVWSEWHMAGTRRDGVAHEMRGVIVFDVAGELISAARFYLEPVEHDSGTVDDAVRHAASPSPAGVTP
jgi:ketosteroid isomerase-like protein